MYDSVICAAMFDAVCVCVVMYDAVCVTSLCELCAACYVYRVCVGFNSARMASPGDVVSLRSTRTVWMGCILGTSPGNEHAIRETTAVLAASERGNQYTVLSEVTSIIAVQADSNFTVQTGSVEDNLLRRLRRGALQFPPCRSASFLHLHR